jgi:hypothetical protein
MSWSDPEGTERSSCDAAPDDQTRLTVALTGPGPALSTNRSPGAVPPGEVAPAQYHDEDSASAGAKLGVGTTRATAWAPPAPAGRPRMPATTSRQTRSATTGRRRTSAKALALQRP